MRDSPGGRVVTSSGVVLEYPLPYTFKIMGLAADDFPEHARRLVARVCGDVPAGGVSVRASAHGKYQSVSVEVTLRSEEERRAVYQVLHDDERVVYYL
jgi:putative lipoic acid-binding regulatory protein